jgi:predicted ester cyclase
MAVISGMVRNKELVRGFERDVFNGRDYDRMADYRAEDYVQYGPMMREEMRGLDASRDAPAFSDLNSENLMMVAEGDYVVSYNRYTGTHDGEFIGIAPTDEMVTVYGQIINRIEDGKAAEGWATVDFMSLLAQVGRLPGEPRRTYYFVDSTTTTDISSEVVEKSGRDR